jgi:hypothetical protein
LAALTFIRAHKGELCPRLKEGRCAEQSVARRLGGCQPQAVRPHLEPTKLKLGVIFCEAGALHKQAYFPQGTVLSLLTVLENGSAIEIHTSLLNMVLHDKPEIEMRDEPIGAE